MKKMGTSKQLYKSELEATGRLIHDVSWHTSHRFMQNSLQNPTSKCLASMWYPGKNTRKNTNKNTNENPILTRHHENCHYSQLDLPGLCSVAIFVDAVVRRPENPQVPAVMEAYHAQQDKVDIQPLKQNHSHVCGWLGAAFAVLWSPVLVRLVRFFVHDVCA